jgi:hypothetical protein
VADEFEERIARNEAIFREVNEVIQSGRGPSEVQTSVAFRCECGQLGCNDLVELTVGDYELVRSHPRHFLVTLGHQRPEIEVVIELRDGFAVVEKRGDAGQVAEETDPRT